MAEKPLFVVREKRGGALLMLVLILAVLVVDYFLVADWDRRTPHAESDPVAAALFVWANVVVLGLFVGFFLAAMLWRVKFYKTHLSYYIADHRSRGYHTLMKWLEMQGWQLPEGYKINEKRVKVKAK